MTPVIDIFAGPGGLGEGFSAFQTAAGVRPFRVALSVEKDATAHRTLELRSFFRQFRDQGVPDSYYQYLRRELSRATLFDAFPVARDLAAREAMRAELGVDDVEIDSGIAQALSQRSDNAWVLIGGPPCQAYSLAGRSRMRSVDPAAFEADHRHVLYREYLRILAKFGPPVFVMENVTGLLSATLDGQSTIARILQDLSRPSLAEPVGRDGDSYRGSNQEYELFSLVSPRDQTGVGDGRSFVIHAEHYGVPQTRHRVILIGVRKDVACAPSRLSRRQPVPIERVIATMPQLRSTLSKTTDSPVGWVSAVAGVLKSPWIAHYSGQNVAAKLVEAVAQLDPGMPAGAEFVPCEALPDYRCDWYTDLRLGGVCNHASRGHMVSDLHRYLFAACFGSVVGRTPRLDEFPRELLPKHSNVESALSGEMFADRFRVQVAGRPATTVTSHISKDGHYFIHYDPAQCRSLTVREAARIQTFPDNYFFEGNRTAQYHQVGNAVPPLLAVQIAGVVHSLLSGVTGCDADGASSAADEPAAYELVSPESAG